MVDEVAASTGGRAGYAGLWRNREYVALWGGQLVSNLGTQASLLAYPLVALDLTHSPAQAGLVGLAIQGARFVARLPAGVLVDGWNRRTLMLVSDGVRAAAYGGMAAALLLGHATLAQLVITAIVAGLFGPLFGPAQSASLRHIVPARLLPEAISLNQAQGTAVSLAGPPVGGLLYQLGRAVPFAADAVSYLVSLLALLTIHTPLRDPGARPPRGLLRPIAEGFGWLWRQPFLRATALAVLGINFVAEALDLALVLTARTHGATAGAIGVMVAMIAAGALLGTLVAPALRRRLPTPVALLGCLWMVAVVVPLLALSTAPYALGAIAAPAYLLAPIVSVILVAHLLASAPDAMQGRASTTFDMLLLGAQPAAPVAVGFLLGAVGHGPTMLVLGGVAVLVAATATASPAIRRTRLDPEAASGSSSN